jgi:hypothetical protein
LIPLDPNVDCSVETWLTKTTYTQKRKEEILNKYMKSLGHVTKKSKFVAVKSFIKDEDYPCYKYPRAINSRTDEFKARTGPIFKLIEEELFKNDLFVKYVPASLRAQVLKDEIHQENASVIGTDYVSWEALCSKDFMMDTEMQLYEYMTQFLPDLYWYELVEKSLTGVNICYFKWFIAQVKAKRMSGEMCTSLGNGFMNAMATLFVLTHIGCKSIKGKVEGDDGVFSFYGPIPTPDDFLKIGLTIKISIYDTVVSGSFCGVVSDFDEMINIRDPIECLLSFGWTSRRYAFAKNTKLMKLMKAKALSLIFQFPGCPILDSFAKYVLRCTQKYHYQLSCSLSTWERNRFLRNYKQYKCDNFKIPLVRSGPKTRELMFRLFRVTVEDQISLENLFDSLNEPMKICSPIILNYCNKDSIDCFEKYVSPRDFNCCGIPAFMNQYRRAIKTCLPLQKINSVKHEENETKTKTKINLLVTNCQNKLKELRKKWISYP